MAWTVDRTQMVMGNKRVVGLEVTTDGAEANIDTGLSYIDAFTVGYQSCNTAPQWIAANSNSTGLATPGTLGLSGFTSGDHFYLMVFGRS